MSKTTLFRMAGRPIFVGLLVTSIGAGIVGAAADGPELQQVLGRFDEVQQSIVTLSADFTERTTSTMLKDPLVSQGRFYLTKPDSIRWEYSVPEAMSFVIAHDEYTGYFPARGRAEKRSIRRWSEQLFRLIGVGQSSEQLSQIYDMALGDSDDPGLILLTLDPKKRRARKRVDEVRFWLDATSYLPRKVEYRGKDGTGREIEFREIRVNPDLAASLYRVEIPPGVEITDGFTAMPSLSPGAAR